MHATTHIVIMSGVHSAGDLIGFTTGLLVALLLLVLTIRAAKLPGTPRLNIVFAFCALLWTAGGLADAAFTVTGAGHASPLSLIAQAVQFCGVAAFPIPIIALWLPYARRPGQRSLARLALWLAIGSASVLSFGLWTRAFSFGRVGFRPLQLLAWTSAALVLTLGASACLSRDTTPRAVRTPSWILVCALNAACGAWATLLHFPPSPGWSAILIFAGSHLVLLFLLCSFILFARFRYADIFIRYGVRIVLAGAWASLLTLGATIFHIAQQWDSAWAIHFFGVMLISNAVLLSFTFIDEKISAAVSRWMFRAPDYRKLAKELSDRLQQAPDDPAVLATTERALSDSLDLGVAKIVPTGDVPWPPLLLEGDIVELAFDDRLRQLLPITQAELLIPISPGGSVSHVLLAAPGAQRPSLLTNDLNFLRRAANECAYRLEGLRRERESIERQSREALLEQQISEAELRALRAQINPHFLFNSLNTIADLIVRSPSRAEEMTVRLAVVFRHVLAHSSRPLTSIHDEVAFLRTYLHIEEARFGDRLQVAIDVDPQVGTQQIPSLILQPLVENALKHGLGPKLGPGRLWIHAGIASGQIELRVEDDGLGPLPGSESDGVGLINVADRLRTLYQEGASVRLAPRPGGGTVVTVLIPLEGGTIPA